MGHRILLAAFLMLSLVPCGLAQNDFDCSSATLFVNRFSSISAESVLPEGLNTKILLSQNFGGFPNYGIDSVTLTVRFDQDPESTDVRGPAGSIRISAAIRSGGKSSTSEIRYSPEGPGGRGLRLDFLRARLTPADAAGDDSGAPAVRFQQSEAGVPVILVSFTGIVAAGGWGDVDSYNAMVLDLRRGELSMPAALGCIDNDFAGQGARGGSAACGWNHARQDYECDTSEGRFFLISGDKIAPPRKAKRKKALSVSWERRFKPAVSRVRSAAPAPALEPAGVPL